MSHIEYKTLDQIKWMREAGLVVAEIHRSLREAARPGVTTGELDEVSADAIRRCGARSNFLNYYGYPATVCISPNDVIVHGIPGKRKLAIGDIVTFDCGAWLERSGQQWHGDAAFSMIVGDEFTSDEEFARSWVRRHQGPGAGKRWGSANPSAPQSEAGETSADSAGEVSRQGSVARRRELNLVTREALWAALASLARGKRVSAVGEAVERVVAERAEDLGWEAGIIEDFTGHGIGTAMHQDPEVLNYRVRGLMPKLRPGMVLAVEPMLTSGDIENVTENDDWTVRTVDGSDAAQWEHTIAILDDGVAILSAVDGGVAGLAPFGVTPVLLD